MVGGGDFTDSVGMGNQKFLPKQAVSVWMSNSTKPYELSRLLGSGLCTHVWLTCILDTCWYLLE
jgi:hypothetical protein